MMLWTKAEQAIAWAAGMAALVAAGSARPASDWPSYLGPCGNFSERSGAKLLDDMTKVRLAWESEETRIGYGKALSSAARGLGPEFRDLPPGGMGSPIVAGGLVVMSYFTPTGEVWDTEVEKLSGDRFLKSRWLVDADDVVIGIDAATGKTRWKQVFAGKGANTGSGKRGGWAITPATADGRVFALGTTGRLYALNLATGKPLWEADIGERHKALEAMKAKALADRRIVKATLYGGLLVVDGVLIAPDFNGGLLGADVKDGKTLWRRKEGLTSGFNMPCPVRIGGKSFIATANRTGDLRLLRPASGEVLWTVALDCEHLTQPVASDEHLFVFQPNPTYSGDNPKRKGGYGVLAAWRFDEKGARRDWALAGEYIHELHCDAGPSRRVVPRDGLVYYLNWTAHPQKARRLFILREKDGAILKSADADFDQFYLWGDRLIAVSDLQHRPRAANAEIWQLHTVDPADFRPLGDRWHVNDPKSPVHVATGGYEVPVYEPFADGFMFCRVMGGIRCYDLRKAAAQ